MRIIKIAWVPVAAVCALGGCVNPAAVSSFAKEAPPAGSFGSISSDYAAVGPALVTVSEISQSPGKCSWTPAAPEQGLRPLEPMHESWVAYMAALGKLSDPALVATSPSQQQVADGLAAAQRDFPRLGITSAEVTAIGALVQLAEDVAVAGLREAALDRVVERADPSFQAAIKLETRAIRDIYLRDLDSYRTGYGLLDHELLVSFQSSLDPSVVPPAQAPFGPEQANARGGCLARAEADGRVFPPANVDAKKAAANAYIAAIGKLAAAHTKLAAAARGEQLLTRGTFEQIQPLLAEARKAWADFHAL